MKVSKLQMLIGKIGLTLLWANELKINRNNIWATEFYFPTSLVDSICSRLMFYVYVYHPPVLYLRRYSLILTRS